MNVLPTSKCTQMTHRFTSKCTQMTNHW